MITEPTPVRSLMNAHGKDVHGSLPALTSSRATTGNIQVSLVLKRKIANELFEIYKTVFESML